MNQLQDLRKVFGTSRESVVREAFKDLLKGFARSRDLIFVPEYEIATPAKDRRYVGALVHTLRVPFGYWEAKDEKKPKDPTIREKFNSYRRPQREVIDLLVRVTTISIRILAIIKFMKNMNR